MADNIRVINTASLFRWFRFNLQRSTVLMGMLWNVFMETMTTWKNHLYSQVMEEEEEEHYTKLYRAQK